MVVVVSCDQIYSLRSFTTTYWQQQVLHTSSVLTIVFAPINTSPQLKKNIWDLLILQSLQLNI